MVLISVVLSFLVGRGSLLIQCQEFEILFVPFISASILIYVRVYNSYVQSYAIIRKIYPFFPVFFHLYSIFRRKPRPSSRFLPFQAVYFEAICTSPACAKSCATLVPPTTEIGANLSQTPSIVSAITSVFSATPPIFSAHPAVLLATNYMLISGHETTIAKHDFLISCPETTVSRLAIILKRAAGAMALVSAQGVAYAGVVVIIIIII